jgi:hypothetical protein
LLTREPGFAGLSHCPGHATRLARPSSPGVPLSFRVLPARLAVHLSMYGTSHWGSFPYSAYGGRSLRGLRQLVPPSQLRSVRRFSQPLDGLLLHPPATPFDVVTLVGFSLQGFPLPNRSLGSSPKASPLGVVPFRIAHSPPRKGEIPGARNADFLVTPAFAFVAYRVLTRPRVRAVRKYR